MRPPINEVLVFLFDSSVMFAGNFLEARPIHDRDCPSTAVKKPGGLQAVCYLCHKWPYDPKQVCQNLMCDRNRVAAGPITAEKKPACQPLLHVVKGDARRVVRDVRKKCASIAEYQASKFGQL